MSILTLMKKRKEIPKSDYDGGLIGKPKDVRETEIKGEEKMLKKPDCVYGRGLTDFVVYEDKMYAFACVEDVDQSFMIKGTEWREHLYFRKDKITVINMISGEIERMLETDKTISLIVMCNQYLVAVTHAGYEWKLVYFDTKDDYKKKEINLNQIVKKDFLTERIENILYDEKTNRILIGTYENEIIVLQ